MHDLTFWETTDFIPVNSAAKLVSDILESQLIHRKKNAEYAKKFFEEIAPITHLANHLKCTSIRFTNDAIEHHSFDAIIKYNDTNEKKVECTCAINGFEDALIDEYLDKYHEVSLNQEITYEGTKQNRKLHKQPARVMFKPTEERYNKIISLINNAVKKKILKSKDDYVGAILLVVVDTSGGSITRLNDFLSNHYSKNKINKFPFNRIFLIPRNPPNYKDLFIEL